MDKILLIDDSPTIQKAVELALKGKCEVVWIQTESAWSSFQVVPEIMNVLIDFTAPFQTLTTILSRVRELLPMAQMTLLCGTLDEPDADELKTYGVINILRKPFDKRSLLRTLVFSGDVAIPPPPPPRTERMKASPPPPPKMGLGTSGALSMKSLEQSVYDELKAGFDLTPVAQPAEPDFVLPDLQSEAEEYASPEMPQPPQAKMPPQTTQEPLLDWDRIEQMVRVRLREYCADWVPSHLDRTMRTMIQDEMKHMDDEQWTKILTKALRDVVQERFLTVAETVIRQELNQLLKEESQKLSVPFSRHN